MDSISFSVVIPAHNRPRLLGLAVESVLAQTLKPLEVVVVDDGSEPSLDPSNLPTSTIPVHLLRNESPLGPSAARNAGVERATGDFIGFLDDDDTWLPQKLEQVAACLKAHPSADIAVHQTGLGNHTLAPALPCVDVAGPLRRMLHHQPPHLDGVVVRRSLHLQHPFDATLPGAEDLDYLIRLAKSGAEVVEIPAKLALLGNAPTTAVGLDKRIEGRLALLDKHPEILSGSRSAAFFYLRLGHQYRRNRQRGAALRSLMKSLRARPSIAPVKGSVLCLFPWAVQRRLDSRHPTPSASS